MGSVSLFVPPPCLPVSCLVSRVSCLVCLARNQPSISAATTHAPLACLLWWELQRRVDLVERRLPSMHVEHDPRGSRDLDSSRAVSRGSRRRSTPRVCAAAAPCSIFLVLDLAAPYDPAAAPLLLVEVSSRRNDSRSSGKNTP